MIKKLYKIHLIPVYFLIIIGFLFISNRTPDVNVIVSSECFCNMTKKSSTTEKVKISVGEEMVIGEDFNFNEDSIALLHIQKTGGTAWEQHIFKHLQVKLNETSKWQPACNFDTYLVRYECLKNQYKFQIFWDRYRSLFCDPHADYTELKNCIMHEYKNRIISPYFWPNMKGIIHFITFLRDPVHRYASEYNHVASEGATWSKAVRTCKDEPLYSQKCFKGKSWKDVEWESFLQCDHNLANNRQVRMLANYNILGCNVLKCWTSASNCTPKQKEFYNQKLLQSAKHTLSGLSFFGLTEYPEESEYLFQKTFDSTKFKFSSSLTKSENTKANYFLKGPSQKYIDKIKELNNLDLKLYEFAKQLFFKRINSLKNKNGIK